MNAVGSGVGRGMVGARLARCGRGGGPPDDAAETVADDVVG